jgi:hypothetical protein
MGYLRASGVIMFALKFHFGEELAKCRLSPFFVIFVPSW